MAQAVRILQHDFPIQRKYLEGHVLNADEAAAFNQLLLENVRNNTYGWVTRVARGRAVLTPEEYSDLAKRIDEYADGYQFKTRSRTKNINPLDATVRELAWQHAESWGIQNGFDITSDEVQRKYADLRHAPQIYAEARKIILNRQSVMDEALEGLL